MTLLIEKYTYGCTHKDFFLYLKDPVTILRVSITVLQKVTFIKNEHDYKVLNREVNLVSG